MIKKYIERTAFSLSILSIVFLYILSVYYLYGGGFYALSADENGHTLEAYYWFIGEGSFFSIWLPFQKILYGLVFHLSSDLFLTPRILSALFGLLTLFSVMHLTWVLFEEKIISLIAGFLLIIFMPFITFSLLPLTEIYSFFFIVTAVSFYLKWDVNKSRYLWLSIFSFSVGTTIRYEGWIFAAIIIILMFFDYRKEGLPLKRSLYPIVAAGIILSVFPLVWIILSYATANDAGHFIYSVTDRYSPANTLTEFKNNVIFQFLKLNVESLNIIGAIPLISLLGTKRNFTRFGWIFFASLILFSAASFIMKAMPTHNFWRLASLWSILLLPFTAYWIADLLKDIAQSKAKKCAFLLFFVLFIIFFVRQTASFTSVSYVNKNHLSVGRYLNGILKNNHSMIYIQKDPNDRWEHTGILIASGLPDRFVTELIPRDSGILKLDSITVHMTKNINEQAITYFLLKSAGESFTDSLKPQMVKRFGSWDLWKSTE